MRTTPRSRINIGEIRESCLPYRVTVIDYGTHKRYDKNPEGEEERQIGVHVTIYDDCEKYIWMGKGLTQKMQSGYCPIRNENKTLEQAIQVAKMDALRSLSHDCNGHESIYACFAKDVSGFINKQEAFLGTGREKKAEGFVAIIEARTD